VLSGRQRHRRRPRMSREPRNRRRLARSIRGRLMSWSSRASSLSQRVTSSPPGWCSSVLRKRAMQRPRWHWAPPSIPWCCRGLACAASTPMSARRAPGTRRPRSSALPTRIVASAHWPTGS